MRLMIVVLVVAGSVFAVGGVSQYFVVKPLEGPLVSSSPSTAHQSGNSQGSLALRQTPQIVPELSFLDGEGRQQSLSDFRGKMILLNIWATWCVPCREEMPALDRLQAKLGSPDFQVVPLSIDRGGLSKVKAFYKKLGLKSLGIFVDIQGQAASRLGAIGVPTTLLITPKGLEIGRLVGPAEWDSPGLLKSIQQQIQKIPDRRV